MVDLDVDGRAAFATLVDEPDGVFARVLSVDVLDVDGDVAEVGGDVIARRRLQRLVVVVDLDAQLRVVDGFDAALEMGRLAFGQLRRALQFGDEARRNGRSLLLGGPGVDAVRFQGADLLPAARIVRVQVHVRTGRDADVASVDGLAERVGRLADVRARIFRIRVQDVQRHVSKVVRRAEPVTGADRRAIDEPLDFQVGVVDGFETALEVSVLALLQVVQTGQRRREDGSRHRNVHLLLGRTRERLQFVDLLQTLLVQRVRHQARLSLHLCTTKVIGYHFGWKPNLMVFAFPGYRPERTTW